MTSIAAKIQIQLSPKQNNNENQIVCPNKYKTKNRKMRIHFLKNRNVGTHRTTWSINRWLTLWFFIVHCFNWIEDVRKCVCTVHVTKFRKSNFCWHFHLSVTYLIFSSGKPRVNNTKPHNSSLNAMPFCVPPHAMYNQSASTGGTPSDKTSCKNDVLLSVVPFEPAERLKASRIRRNSDSLTGIK